MAGIHVHKFQVRVARAVRYMYIQDSGWHPPIVNHLPTPLCITQLFIQRLKAGTLTNKLHNYIHLFTKEMAWLQLIRTLFHGISHCINIHSLLLYHSPAGPSLFNLN